MDTTQQQVLAWSKLFCPEQVASVPNIPTEEIIQLRIKLWHEEIEEWAEAARKGDLVEMADALGDIKFVTNGAAIACGMDLEPIHTEIFESNMSKAQADGTILRREDGKVLKGENFRLPNLAPIVEAMQDEEEYLVNPIQTLWCQSCNRNHTFNASDIERIVYNLEGLLHDHTINPIEPEYREYHANQCLLLHLAESKDGEGYGEYTEANIEARKRNS